MKEFSFTKKIYRKKTINRIKNKINLLGNSKYDVNSFLIVRLILSLILFFILVFSKSLIILAPIISIIFYFAYEYFLLDIAIKRRRDLLNREAVFFFEVLSTTLKTTNSLKKALSLVVKNINNDLSYEFSKALKEVEIGKSFALSLEEMQKRIPSEEINNLILNICEAMRSGNDIENTLNIEINSLREKRFLIIKNKLSKIPLKVLILTIILIGPIIAIIFYGPTIIDYILS